MKRAILSLSLLAVAALSTAAFTSTPAPAKPAPELECRVVDRYIAAHPEAVPTTFAAFSAMDITFRKRVYSHIPLGTRAAWWHVQLQTWLTSDKLNMEQRTIVADVDRRLGYFLDSTLTDEQRATRAKPTVARITAAFPAKLAHVLFANLGPVDVAAEAAIRIRDAEAARTTNVFQLASYRLKNFATTGKVSGGCVCGTGEWDPCPEHMLCHTSNCQPGRNCGMLGLFTCDGSCSEI